ncbi:MAG: HD domain-containing protein [Deltaproteobacteria bacterium]|nr:HD domain-containing protein [Deltaproteobacteria bacterium]
MMKLDTAFLGSKVGRRIFVLFVCCALLPIGALAILSFTHVTRQLNEQSQRRLQQATKAVGMGIYERLIFLKTEMSIVASKLDPGVPGAMQSSVEAFDQPTEKRFKAIMLVTEQGTPISLHGAIENPPLPTREELEQINAGKTVISIQKRSDLPLRIFMMRSLKPQDPKAAFFMGEIDTGYLFGLLNAGTLPPMTELCVLDQSRNVLASSLPAHAPFAVAVGARIDGSASRRFEWEQDGKEYVASWWTIFLKSQFVAPNWTVVLSQWKADVLAPMANFKKMFPLVVLMSLWVVLLLSVIQIRRNLVPLKKLKEGTLQVAKGDFDTRVAITSADEFQELAGSFNTMSRQLGRQFQALTTVAEIDRAILSALDTEKIVETVLTRMRDVFSCDGVSVSLIDSKETSMAHTYVEDDTASRKPVETAELSPDEVQRLNDNREHLIIERDERPPGYLEHLANNGMKSFLVLPIFLQERLSGIITLGYTDSPPRSPDETMSFSSEVHEILVQARQLADQVAVALSNAHLIEELDQLNWGTLTALARAVDAKSPWTAGHSERVTDMTLEIGTAVGLTPKELDTLRRGALLHDVGKIGVSAAILDKPGKLTDEEYENVKRHPSMGARILEPISAYAEIIPIVLQHHEQFGGRGYPHGLAGETICLGARIVAVADVFDALVSDRPYRSGWEKKRAIEFIREGAGSQFDRNIVKAFLDVMGKEEKARQAQTMFVRWPDTPTMVEQHR